MNHPGDLTVTAENAAEYKGLTSVGGAVQGGAAGETNQRDVIRRCMAGRGYSVLG